MNSNEKKENKNGKSILKKLLFRFNILYIAVIVLLCAAACFFNPAVSAAGLLLVVLLIVAEQVLSRSLTKKMSDYIEHTTLDIDEATRASILNIPTLMAVVRLDGAIMWYNQGLYEAFGKEELYNRSISSFFADFHIDGLAEKNAEKTFYSSANARWYDVSWTAFDYMDDAEYLVTLYFTDVTERVVAQERYEAEAMVIAEITIDNYEDILQDTQDSVKPQLIALLDQKINQWAEAANGVLKKTERDKYTLFFEKQYLDTFIHEKFKILDEVRAINIGNKLPPTLSIGISPCGESLVQKDIYAKSAVSMALGRGGDQVVLKTENDFTYYGGKSKEIEKHTKVKSRVVAYALRGLMLQSDNIVIMSHKNMDMDGMGAAMGIFAMARSLGKHSNIMVNRYDATVGNLMQKISQGGLYNGVFVSKQQALDLIGPSTLLVVVDTHKTTLAESQRALELARNVVLIDHHRRSADFISKAVLTYHEAYASSTCEMVTEMLQYMSDRLTVNPIDAEAMYAGIVIDTKNFSFKTGVRTFEAAAYLRKRGVDPISVKHLLQSDMETMLQKNEIISYVQPYHDCVAISAVTLPPDAGVTVAAQAADELLEVRGIEASFVLAEKANVISISGRSMGTINVQVILERLGGGGHMAVAGAQLADVTLEEAYEQLTGAIDEYFQTID